MGKKKKASSRKDKFALVLAGDIDSVKEDPEPNSDERQTWLETLEPLVADDLMTSLRSIFSITYRHDMDDDAEDKMLAEIRKLATEALSPFADHLHKLRLKPVQTDKKDDRVKVFTYVIVNYTVLNKRVTLEETGKKVRLGDVIRSAPADALLVNLRTILSITFSEVFSYKERMRSLWEIRQLAAEALVPLNPQLEDIEIEPVGMPTLPFDEELYDGESEGNEDE